METHYKLKARKLNDLEQYGGRECLKLNRFQAKAYKPSKNCEEMVNQFIRNTLMAGVDDKGFNCIHQIEKKKKVLRWWWKRTLTGDC